MQIPIRKTWADFGCSNGFIIEHISERHSTKFDLVYGYDHSPDLIKLARKKKWSLSLPLNRLDLNSIVELQNKFYLVTCFETLEHVGKIENAVQNLYVNTENSGEIIISVPNEVGLVGIIKFITRLFIRKNAYPEFFTSRVDYLRYFCYLLFSKDIRRFRRPPRNSWGPHLGFDYRKLIDFINNHYIKNNKLRMAFVKYSFLKTNV